MKITKSGLPMINQTELLAVLNKAKEHNKGVIVLGLPGIGKTYTMKEWLKETYPNNLQLISYSADKISSDYSVFGPKIFKDAEIAGNKIPYIGRVPLFIDDLGTEKLSSYYGSQIDVIENIILRIYEDNKFPFYATSNLDIDLLTNRYGERIIERLKELCIILVMEGPNYRNNIFEENQKIVESL
jgi:GTPase SAR1 family protein